LTLGVAGFALLVIGVIVAARHLITSQHLMHKSERRLQMLGLCNCLLLALGSIGDYPLGTPIHLSILAIAIVWIFLVPEIARSGEQPGANATAVKLGPTGNAPI
jgi:hypothetical protein